MGLVDIVVDYEKLLFEANASSKKIALIGSFAVSQGKIAITNAAKINLSTTNILEAEAFGLFLADNDQKDRIPPLLNKAKRLLSN